MEQPTRPAAIANWVDADRALDLARMRAQLAPDVRLISPLTDAFDFSGPDEVMSVFESAFALLRDIEIVDLTGADRDWVLHGSNTLAGRNFEEVQWLRLDDDGLIDRITLFIRPAPAAIALLARIGIGLHKRGVMGRSGALASRLARPLAAALGLADRLLMPRLK